MNENNDGINFEAITEKLQVRHLGLKEHPLYGILIKCGEEEVVKTFLSVLQNQLFEVIFSLLLLAYGAPAVLVFRRSSAQCTPTE
jgi:hypothetical protein